MANNLVEGVRKSTLGERLKSARQEAGFTSAREVALQMPIQVRVSHATLLSYERDETTPNMDVLSAIAYVYQCSLTALLSNRAILTGVRYRALKSKVGVKDRQRFLAECQRWVEAYANVQQHLKHELKQTLKFEIRKNEGAKAAAGRLREALKLDPHDRLLSVCELLEKMGIWVLEIETDLAIDGIAARYGDISVVFLNVAVSPDRARLNAAHEAAHHLFGDCMEGGDETPEAEKRAMDFASYLILTSEMLAEAFCRKSVVDMMKFKERYGISLSAMVYRAKLEKKISEREYKHLMIEFTKRGWRKAEPGQVWPDRSLRFEALIDSALVSGKQTLSQLASIAGVREEELGRRLAIATGAENYREEMEDEEPVIEPRRLKLASL